MAETKRAKVIEVLDEIQAIIAEMGNVDPEIYLCHIEATCFQAIRKNESVIIANPNNCVPKDISDYLTKIGYTVRHLSLYDIPRSDGWDCIRAIEPKTAIRDAGVFAETIAAVFEKDRSGRYYDGTVALLGALILRVVLDPNRKPEDKTIGVVIDLVNTKNEDELDELFDPNCMPEALTPCLSPYLSFKRHSLNLRLNIQNRLAADLQAFREKDLCNLLSTGDIDLNLPAQKPCAYFCDFPTDDEHLSWLPRLFFSMGILRTASQVEDRNGEPMPVKVNLLLGDTSFQC